MDGFDTGKTCTSDTIMAGGLPVVICFCRVLGDGVEIESGRFIAWSVKLRVDEQGIADWCTRN
eukprot:6727516-Alexandrium_andersonii.AAC.1